MKQILKINTYSTVPKELSSKFKIGDYVRMKTDTTGLFEGPIVHYIHGICPHTFETIMVPVVKLKYGNGLLKDIDEEQLEEVVK